MKGTYKNISLDRILDPEKPLRDDLSHDSVDDLSTSIKQIGIINPLIVKRKGDNYELIAGHRRLVAAKIAGLTEAPCIVVKAKGIKGEIIKLQENIIRRNINPIAWANHLHHLKSQYKLENAKVAEMLGMSDTWVSQHLQILDYPEPLLEGLKEEKLSFSSARELAQIRDPKKRDLYIRHAIRGGVTPTLAATWRRQANSDPLTQNPQPQEEQTTTPPGPSSESLTQCAVCGENIKSEESMTLVIHQKCQPQEIPPSVN